MTIGSTDTSPGTTPLVQLTIFATQVRAGLFAASAQDGDKWPESTGSGKLMVGTTDTGCFEGSITVSGAGITTAGPVRWAQLVGRKTGRGWAVSYCE